MKGKREMLVLQSSGFRLSRTSLLLIFAIFAAFLLPNQDGAEAALTHVTEKCGANSSNAIEYAPNGTFQSNLNRLLTSLSASSDATPGGYYRNSTAASGTPDAVYGASLCRGDVSAELCQECVEAAAEAIVKNCAHVRSAIVWYDECKLRYSNDSFFSRLAEQPRLRLRNVANVSDGERFMRLRWEVMNDVITRAVKDRKPPEFFAVRKANFTDRRTLRALAQCTPDIAAEDCEQCLTSEMGKLPQFGSEGAQVLMPSCYLRYELYTFYNETAAVDAEAPPPASPTRSPRALLG